MLRLTSKRLAFAIHLASKGSSAEERKNASPLLRWLQTTMVRFGG
jgi:hypothetical protein